ncbi:MAG: hypothetical protein ABIZ49_10480, partial [Opitutaceae bacterium]
MPKLSVRAENPVALAPKTPAKSAGSRAIAGFVRGGSGTARKRRRSFGRPINGKGLAVFTRQLATLVKAGMP